MKPLTITTTTVRDYHDESGPSTEIHTEICYRLDQVDQLEIMGHTIIASAGGYGDAERTTLRVEPYSYLDDQVADAIVRHIEELRRQSRDTSNHSEEFRAARLKSLQRYAAALGLTYGAPLLPGESAAQLQEA